MMNRQQAVKYDSELREIIESYAKNYGEDDALGKNIVDQFVEFLPDNEIKGMVFLDGDPVSRKLGNVRLDLKQAMLAGVEFAASVSRPESIFNYIQLLIISILFIRNVTEQKLSGVEARAVYLLHMKNAYTFGIDEEQFICDVQEWYCQKGDEKPAREKVVEAINHLYTMKTADFDNGKIYLKERVWGRMEKI